MVTDLRDKYTDYHEDWYRMIAYHNGKRIVQDHLGNLYYEMIPKSCIRPDDLINRERLEPIRDLPQREQAAIREFVQDHLSNI